ncbi:hypothetical protein AGMMS49921_01430 [Endomicrobiia bacterium]|nr:hypothetical protein AGMMS49921_01430 [Endomicrobiia bacterium]
MKTKTVLKTKALAAVFILLGLYLNSCKPKNENKNKPNSLIRAGIKSQQNKEMLKPNIS